jgi:hypothetical protein
MTGWHGTIAGVATMATIGCGGTALPVESPGQSLSGYFTYFVLDNSASGAPAVDGRVRSAIAMTLADKGLAETPPDTAEAVFVVHTATPSARSPEAFYRGWGGWDWFTGELPVTGHPAAYAPGTLVIDMFDAWTKQVIWRGTQPLPTGGRSQTEDAVDAAVHRLFRTFPPAGSDVGVAFHHDEPVDADAMRIVFSQVPAALVRVEGEPRYEPVPGTRLERITNTDSLIVRDVAGVHYLRFKGVWMEGDDLTGPWSPAGMAPEGAEIALAFSPRESGAGRSADTADALWRAIYVTTTPAALVVTDGPPQFLPVEGAALHHVTNTSTPIYREPTDQEIYVAIPGGWYRAWTLAGPWQHVTDAQLPDDIKPIALRTAPAHQKGLSS